MTCLEFSNKFGKKAKVWLDDLPSGALLSNETVRETNVLEGGPVTALRKRVAIEIFQPFGASFHYGLLGGEFQSTEGNELKVIVPLDTPFPERRYGDSLAGSLDAVVIGGLPEYVNAIYTGLEQAGVGARPCGVLNLTCMAHGEIGSASTVFSSLARALMLALCRSDQPASLDDVVALLAA
jgi:hypothetical protein